MMRELALPRLFMRGALGLVLACGLSVSACARQEAEAAVVSPSEALEADFSQLGQRLDYLAAQDRFMGVVLVARGDQVLFRQAYGMADREGGAPLRPDSRLRLASISKQFTAAAILHLQDEGKLSVEDPVCRWITPCPAGWETMRISHLLSHTSGLPDLMQRPDWGRRRVQPTTLAELTAQTMLYRPQFEPGTKTDYNNAAYNLAADIVQRASGLSYNDYLQQTFFDPLGMADTGSDADDLGHGIVYGYTDYSGTKARHPVSNVSVVWGAGALYSTVDDLLKWEQALHGGRLLSLESYRQMIADHAPSGQPLRPGARPRAWGYGQFVSDLPVSVVPAFSAAQIYHTGSWAGFRNMESYEPRSGVFVIVLTNNYHQTDEVFLVVQQAMASALGEPFPAALREDPLPSATQPAAPATDPPTPILRPADPAR